MFKLFDKVVGELVTASSKEVLFEECIDRLESYGTTARVEHPIADNVEDCILIIQRGV